MISVAVLEDDFLMQARLVEILNSWDYVQIVISVDSNADFAKASEKVKFDVLLADISICDGNGIDSVRLLKRKNPEGISIIVSSNSKPDVILEAVKAGAIGYIYKDDSRIEILQAIRSGLQGESPISPGIAFKILKSLSEFKAVDPEAYNRASEILSAREAEILQLISRGLSNNEVGQVLGLSKNTIPVHLRNIYKKLGATRRTEAVFEARQLGIIQ